MDSSKRGAGAQLNAQVLEEAATWFVDFSEGEVDAAGRVAFDAWLRRSPEHVRAYLQVASFWEEAPVLGRDQDLDTEALIERALAHGNVLELDAANTRNAMPAGAAGKTAAVVEAASDAQPASGVQLMHRSAWHHRTWRHFAAAASVAVTLAVAGTVAWLQGYRVPTYETSVGEQRLITLHDGSTVELNSRSRLRVRFTEQERTVDLLEGQALFKVAKNPARPFIVHSGVTSARAVGTQFDVYRMPDRTVVTVLEGRVAVSNALHAPGSPAGQPAAATGTSEASTPVLLVAGEQISVTARVIADPQPANVEAATAWTQQKLIFSATPLREVVAEFNRYNRVRLVIDDHELDDFHVSGVFASTSAQSMLDFLQRRFDVVITGDEHEVHIRRAAGEAGVPTTTDTP